MGAHTIFREIRRFTPRWPKETVERYTVPVPDSVLHITVKPKAPRTEVARTPDGLLVRVTAPPVEGAANTAVILALAQALGIPKSRLSIAAGATGRVKRVLVRGLSQEELDARIAGLP